MGTLLGAALLGGLFAAGAMALLGRMLVGFWRDFTQSMAMGAGAYAAGTVSDYNPVAMLASWGVTVLLYALYEWIVASSDAAKTVVISRHTGRRLPPI